MATDLRNCMAGILTATALAVALVAGGYLYLRGQFVTDPAFAETHISEVSHQRGFDLAGARKSGYSDPEVATFIVKRDEAEFLESWKTLLIAVGSVYCVVVLGFLASAISRSGASGERNGEA